MAGREMLTWIDPRALDREERQELWNFVARYEDLSFGDFEDRIEGLSTALIARHDSGAIGGIVAARIFTTDHAGAERAMVWGEWGFLDPPFRRRLLLERAMLHGAMPFLLRHPLRPVYFMAEVASWKGYLALVRGFTHLWPRPGNPLPEAEQRMVIQVLDGHGDPEWDPARAVFHRGKAMLPDDGATRVPERLRGLHEFYRSANPGQPEGDSLLCVARVTWASLLSMPIRTLLAQRLAHASEDRAQL
ncbi:MAG: hypothetical protein K0S65_6165 [Labilithrix sp.]|nr:hypothetical protein [Labilithrix sp.]